MDNAVAAQQPYLSERAAALATHLHGALARRWQVLNATGEELDPLSGPITPDETAPYRAAPVPDDLRGRRAELIVEASDAAALAQALTCGADALVLDFDDTFAPTAANMAQAYHLLTTLSAHTPPLLARPRALYAHEPHLSFAGQPGIAMLCDLAALLTFREADPPRPPHLYLPKLDSVPQAQFWDDALTLAEEWLGWPRHTVRVCLQIETWPGLRRADALLFTLRGRAYGLNAGRWDYVFSLTKHWAALAPAGTVMPPRRLLGMDADAMQAYAETLVQLCRERGTQAIGGSAALAPDPHDPAPTLALVQADKRREAQQGFVAAWAGVPELLAPVRAGFVETEQAAVPPSQRSPSQRPSVDRLLALPPAPPLALADLRDAIGLALDVFEAWYAGRGVIVRQGRIEDTATAELARAQLWQWVRVQAPLEGGSGACLTPERYRQERRAQCPDETPEARLLDALTLAPTCPAYFPRAAQLLDAPPVIR